MPKKIFFHSAVHQFVHAADTLAHERAAAPPELKKAWNNFVDSFSFDYLGDGKIRLTWQQPQPGAMEFRSERAMLYNRGDHTGSLPSTVMESLQRGIDPVQNANGTYYRNLVLQAADLAQFPALSPLSEELPASDIHRKEAEFHDEWAASTDLTQIPVRQMNEACTAPEMRFIRAALGPLENVRLLDVGCGLGEAAVYFALEGAQVTASDLSPGMCQAAQRLAELNGVSIKTVQSSFEDLHFPEKFDVVYAGNVFHHSEIPRALDAVCRVLKPGGVLVSWDPIAYNPVINIYRRMAMNVRTEDEHPLRAADFDQFTARFEDVKVRCFWLTTLVIFLLMYLSGRHPGQVRYWKKVVEEAPRWAWLYKPLEKLDSLLLRLLPFLRFLCWNAVVVARNPRTKPS
jgi:2-polyprenyl-3-methyl-5-hydroxy-6-metoxy-1,4-benzoquinol methylase